jgi:hypothetical protein
VWPRGWVHLQLYSSMTAALEVGEWSAARPGRTLPPEKNWYPFYRRLGVPQGRSGRAENLVPTGIRSRTVQPVAQSLYRLRYPAAILLIMIKIKVKLSLYRPQQVLRRMRLPELIDSRHMKVVRFPSLRTGRLYLPTHTTGTHF